MLTLKNEVSPSEIKIWTITELLTHTFIGLQKQILIQTNTFRKEIKTQFNFKSFHKVENAGHVLYSINTTVV